MPVLVKTASPVIALGYGDIVAGDLVDADANPKGLALYQLHRAVKIGETTVFENVIHPAKAEFTFANIESLDVFIGWFTKLRERMSEAIDHDLLQAQSRLQNFLVHQPAEQERAL